MKHSAKVIARKQRFAEVRGSLADNEAQFLAQCLAAAQSPDGKVEIPIADGGRVPVDPMGMFDLVLDLDTPERRQAEQVVNHASRDPGLEPR